MHAKIPGTLALALLPELLAARAVQNDRRAVHCDFSFAANPGDTCDSFAAGWGISVDELKALNPGLDCNNFDSNGFYCISGTATPDPPSQSSTTSSSITTTSSSSTTIFSSTSTTTSKATSSAAQPAPTSNTPSPTQPGIAPNCDKYHLVVSGDQCGAIEAQYGISNDQFSSWNPYIDSQCSNLWVDYYVCVHVPGAAPPSSSSTPAQPAPTSNVPSPTQPGIAPNCDQYYLVASGDQCGAIEATHGISAAQFSAWNPYIDSQCSNLWVGYYVCVHVPGAAPPSSTSTPAQPAPTNSAPSPTQPGIAPNCDIYYKVASGDQCGTIEARYGISAAQFSQWNPYIDSSCSNLWVDYYVCVHVPGATAPSPTSPSPSPTPSPNGPQPQMPNTISTCRAFHQVVSGDSCAVIDAAANISLNDFLKWNPFVDASCDNLWLGYYVCVGA